MNNGDKCEKLKLSIECENGRIKELFEISGRNLEFKRIAYQLRKKRSEYLGKYGRDIRIVKLEHYEQREIAESEYENEILGHTPFTNTKVEYVLSEAMPLVKMKQLKKAIRENLKLEEKVDREIIMECVRRKFPASHWEGYTTISSALDILFVTYKDRLKR
ncbi:MAG: hypothetical protein Q7S27_00900 [Nanoarchaeota archaeon]|nr:hypothetical protein [Nanoarchaeota archaeon]